MGQAADALGAAGRDEAASGDEPRGTRSPECWEVGMWGEGDLATRTTPLASSFCSPMAITDHMRFCTILAELSVHTQQSSAHPNRRGACYPPPGCHSSFPQEGR